MTTIAVLVGSLREESFNRKLAQNLESHAPEGVEFRYAAIGDIPLFNYDIESELPESVRALKMLIETSDGVLFVTPEYNRSISGVLKNAIDWATRPSRSNSFKGKPAGIVGASDGRLGTASAQTHLRSILVYLGMVVMGQPEIYLIRAQDVFDENGTVSDTLERERLIKYIDALSSWVETKK